MDRTTLTANLKPLERRGLLKVAVDKEDKRARRLLITAAGRNCCRRPIRSGRRTHAEVERLITSGSADQLRGALRTGLRRIRSARRSSSRFRLLVRQRRHVVGEPRQRLHQRPCRRRTP